MLASSLVEGHSLTDGTDASCAPQGDGPDVPVLPPLVYVGAFLLAVGLELLVPTPRLPLPLGVTIGVLGLATWLGLDPLAMWLFSKARTPVTPAAPATELVTGGPYRYSRNPMYLGMLILLATAGLAFGVLWVLAFVPIVALVVDRLIIRREEEHLERQFGEQYRAYQADVRRWV